MQELKAAGVQVLVVSWWGPRWRSEGADTQARQRGLPRLAGCYVLPNKVPAKGQGVRSTAELKQAGGWQTSFLPPKNKNNHNLPTPVGTALQGVHTDLVLPRVLEAAELEGYPKIAFHLEPYPGSIVCGIGRGDSAPLARPALLGCLAACCSLCTWLGLLGSQEWLLAWLQRLQAS
jgi:hypothetical protein